VQHRLLPFTLVACLFLAGACADGEDPPATGKSPTAATDAAGSTTSTPTPTDEPTASSTVEPASGVRLKLSAISANAPQGWKMDDLATDYQVAANHPKLVTSLVLLQVPDPSDGAGGVELAARQSLRAGSWLQKPKILEPTEINGVEVYHIAGRVDIASFIEEFGTTVEGQAVRIRLQMVDTMSKRERREIVESVLQTVRIGA
jgi:hypothetical protein